ncbi:MAG: type II secretion system protein [Alphaproteobacteria bacterium 64-6]|nr:type II secretion system F family protein [Hyphomicrobium sp.]MBN9264049.1 type II secretion system F family protein [Hyphomicrobium sp.]OJU27946.1 MAG: type II secretion system protein [Alphaproteobacteria bacterium 64-6]
MVDLIEAFMNPQLLVMLLAAAATFATVLTVAMPLLSRDRMAFRMKSMATERDKMRAARMAEFSREGQAGRLRQTPKGFMQEIVNRLNLRKAFDTDEVRDLLKMAGLRGQAPLVAYMFFRLVMPIIVTIVALIYLFGILNLQHPPIAKFGMAIAAGYCGFYLPNVFLKNLVQKRQASISQAFPDALDMLLICVQAGMSIEAAFGKVSKEVSSQSLELAEEFSLTTAELSYLQERRAAFENLGKRTGIAGIKAVATALIQAERYGTPVGQALRVMAKENRDMRMSEAERKAAALPPKLTVPMIVFFLPVLFIVILGPAIIQVMKLN